MAKIPFTKLKLTKREEVKEFVYNEQTIQVKQYLPINDKLTLITNAVNAAWDNNFVNPMKLEIFGALEIVYAYTNINFTEKQKEDPAKLYDLLDSNGIIGKIAELIPEEEYSFILESIEETAYNLHEYQNSFMGILEATSKDYAGLEYDAEKVKNDMSAPEVLGTLKEVLDKLG